MSGRDPRPRSPSRSASFGYRLTKRLVRASRSSASCAIRQRELFTRLRVPGRDLFVEFDGRALVVDRAFGYRHHERVIQSGSSARPPTAAPPARGRPRSCRSRSTGRWSVDPRVVAPCPDGAAPRRSCPLEPSESSVGHRASVPSRRLVVSPSCDPPSVGPGIFVVPHAALVVVHGPRHPAQASERAGRIVDAVTGLRRGPHARNDQWLPWSGVRSGRDIQRGAQVATAAVVRQCSFVS